MKLRFFELYNKIADSAKKEVIIHGLGCNNDVFREIKKSVNGLMKLPGFKNTSSVSFKSYKVLVEPLFKCKLYGLNNTARLLFKGYFLNKTELVQIVSEQLKERGYNITIPDFENDHLIIDFLQNEDIFYAKDEFYFFRPNGNKIEGINEEEASLIAILLGWSAIESDGEEKTAQEVKCVENTTEIINDINRTEDDVNIEINERDKVCTKNDFELRLNQLHQDFLKTSSLLLEIVEALNNGKIPEDYRHIDLIQALEHRFNELKVEIKIHDSLKITSIQELRDAYQEIERENNFLTELIKKALSTLITYKTIYHVTGKSFPFFQELDLLAESYKKEINEQDTAFNKDWFIKLTEEVHFFNYFIKAVRHRLIDNYDREELDEILDKLEKESELHGFSFFNKLSNQINRGDLNFKTEDTPIQPEDPTKKKKANKNQPEVKEKNKTEAILEGVAPEFEQEIQVEPEDSITEEEETESLVAIENVEEIHVEPVTQKKLSKESLKVEKKKESNIENDNEVKVAEGADAEKEIIHQKKPVLHGELSTEDLNILKLLEGNEPQLAFHLSKCYEQEEKKLLLPSYVIENLFLSTEIYSSEGTIAEQIALNISNYESADMSSNVELGKRLFYIASMLQPVLFAYHTTGAGALVNEISFEKMPELSELKKFIYEYMFKYGTSINLDIVKIRSDSYSEESEKGSFIIEFKNWNKSAQVNRFRSNQGHPYTLVWHLWMKEDGWIGKGLKNFFLKQEINEIQAFITSDIKSTWNKQLNKDIKLFMHGKKMDDQERANVWLENQINELVEYLNGAIKLFSLEKSNQNSYDPNDVFNFARKLVIKLDSYINNCGKKYFDNLFTKVANQYVSEAIVSLRNVLVNNVSEAKVESINRTTNYPLLYLDYYECGVSWEPKSYDSFLKIQIESKTDLSSWNRNMMVEHHLEYFNVEALSKITQVNEELRNSIDLASINYEAINMLNYRILTAKMEVEKGCARGYLGEEKRLGIIGELDGIERSNKSNQEGVNLPLVNHKIELVLQELEENRIKQVLKAIELIQSNFKEEERNKLQELLNESNILVFHETLELIKKKKFEVYTKPESHFSNFFNNVLSQKVNLDAQEILDSMDKRKPVYNIVFEGLPFPQLEEAKKMVSVWFSIKQYSIKSRVNLSFDDLYVILDGIGFKDAYIRNSQRKRSIQYYDFDCTPIKDKNRCPIPQFGSIANGKYRLICFWDGPPEEELNDDVKEFAPPETYKPVIVFNFCKMSQQRRKDLATVSRTYKSSFLVLDEFLLLYLCGIRGSRLPVFFKLATPFTYVEPYQTASSNLPQEMFYGRTMQIQQLKNATGDVSCLIYGGRQLGKTVLQKEVQRIFHHPESNNYSIYIDLRERGIGNHREISEITSVLIEDLKAIPNLIPERIQYNIGIDKLMQKLSGWFDANKEARIILFLDESDSFLELDAEMEWKHLLPLKGLMEKTDKRFKVIFSGLHNVKRANEIPNNPLAHLGNPICIGPMIGDEETSEAQRLIELPLENLGFQFESKDLVYMILSHANWYPSLIQIICSRLVNVMYSKRITRAFPQIIGVEEISEALNQCRDQIKEKFALTLKLDPSYDLITNVIAFETINNPEIQTIGIPLDNIVDQLKDIWSEGFESSNTKMDVHYFLQEMVDLGILRETKSNYYALRTSNIIDLIGTKEQIEENVYIKDRELKKEFKPKISRILFTKNGREQRSPFPASIFYMIKDPKSKVLVLKGNVMSGLGHVEEFLKNRKEVNLILPENLMSVKDIESFIEDIDKRRSKDKDDVILINNQIPYGLEQIEFTKNKIEKKERLNALFLMDPDHIRRIIFRNDKSFERIENQGIKLINMPSWKSSVLEEWFKETGCINAEIPEIIKVTSHWHGLVDDYHLKIFQQPEKWKEKLHEFENDIFSQKDKYLELFGINSKESVQILTELIQLNGTESRMAYLEYQEICDVNSANNFIDYLLSLNVVDNNLIVDAVIQKLIINE